MYELYKDLTPEETVSISDTLLKIARRICGSHYVDDLSIRIEREKSVLKRSLAVARENEFSRLLGEADAHFAHSLSVFQDLAEVKSRIDFDPIEQGNAVVIYSLIKKHTQEPTFPNRTALLDSIGTMISIFDNEPFQSGINRLGLTLLYSDLKSKVCILSGLLADYTITDEDIPPPSIAGRRLATTLRDLHLHVAGYSRIGNREYRKLLGEIDLYLAEKHKRREQLQAS